MSSSLIRCMCGQVYDTSSSARCPSCDAAAPTPAAATASTPSEPASIAPAPDPARRLQMAGWVGGAVAVLVVLMIVMTGGGDRSSSLESTAAGPVEPDRDAVPPPAGTSAGAEASVPPDARLAPAASAAPPAATPGTSFTVVRQDAAPHRFVGCWRTVKSFNGIAVELVMLVTPDRAMSVAMINQQDLNGDGMPDPFVIGVLEAADGRFRTTPVLGQAEKGEYVFPDAESLRMTTESGDVTTWRRVDLAEVRRPIELPAGAPPGQNLRQAEVTAYIAMGRVLAEHWQPDAMLVRVKVDKPNALGQVNLADRPYGSVALTFFSPSIHEILSVSTGPGDGKLYAHRLGGGTPATVLPIPPAVRDLTEVVRYLVQEHGLRGAIDSAELPAHDAEGKPVLAWLVVKDRNAEPRGRSLPLIDAVRGVTTSTEPLVTQYRRHYLSQALDPLAVLRSTVWGGPHAPATPNVAPNPALHTATNAQLQRLWDAGDLAGYDRLTATAASTVRR